MPLPVPNLDDRSFDQLVAEARALIPRNFPLWTDHNPSDPGITLLELFAFLAEAAIYQINRVPERSLEQFAHLVGVGRDINEPIDHLLRRALEALKDRGRAITEGDFEALAIRAAPKEIARTKAVVENEETVTVIIVPCQPDDPLLPPSQALRQRVFLFLRERCLITTRVWVVGPKYEPLTVAATIVRDRGSRLDTTAVRQAVEQTIGNFLSPLSGGVWGQGWEFGRSVYRSELYQVIEGIPGVDHIQQLLLNGSATRGAVPLATRTSLVRLDSNLVTVVDSATTRGA
jgi:hypothetical protein